MATERKKVRNSRLPTLERRADIVAAARAAIAEKGHENISLSDLAKRAGIVEGTLYRFFENKQDMLFTVVAEWYEEITRERRSIDNISGTWNKLRYLVAEDLTIIKEHPELTRFILAEIRPNPNYTNTVFYKLNKRYAAAIRSVCTDAIESGEFRDDISPNIIRDMIFGCIEHRTWAYLRGTGDFSVSESADAITNVIYGGMLRQPVEQTSKLDQVMERLDCVMATLEKQSKAS